MSKAGWAAVADTWFSRPAAMVSDQGGFQPLLDDLTMTILLPLTVEKGFGAGYFYPGRVLVFSKALSTILLHQNFVQVFW